MPMRICRGIGRSRFIRSTVVDHRQRHVGDRMRVVRSRLGQAANHHIGVSDRLDLLDPKVERQPVKLRKQSVQKTDQSLRPKAGTKVW